MWRLPVAPAGQPGRPPQGGQGQIQRLRQLLDPGARRAGLQEGESARMVRVLKCASTLCEVNKRPAVSLSQAWKRATTHKTRCLFNRPHFLSPFPLDDGCRNSLNIEWKNQLLVLPVSRTRVKRAWPLASNSHPSPLDSVPQ